MINYKNITPQESTIVDNLPAGAYIGIVKGAKLETINTTSGTTFDRLVIMLDVAEGEHKDHYLKQYESQKGGQFPAKWKGTIRYNIPQSGSQYEAGQRKALEHLAWCLQESNKGYKWDGDETKLKGLKVGFSVRERDWIMERDGGIQTGTTTEIGRTESVQKVAEGKVKLMKKKELSEADKGKLRAWQNEEMVTNNQMTEVYDDELPF